ncbi:hypothetical protein SAV14893_072150 [Streptomyces avermitilis]|uniref:Uncharacterized protein n=1 Tax=Streptomyces avermitilis TaxID=33903 RepID=A0A4D4MIM0_STRAX|nr:hypothetical protein SAVMC3_85000 [Streptomyces avermitilis]GDY67822.1 hypothetical protein SAV14893_072150 [Streptomyces avermitilis]GDY71858.1 hypothetical protein SAV31267_013430 [Streptomyces avermitilis]GDY81032.1 hypothetical protein SAVCW2_02310 [Streptomyces avermitilis]
MRVGRGNHRSRKNEYLFEDAVQSFSGFQVRAERFEGKFGTRRSRSASRNALTGHVRNYSASGTWAQPL